MEFFPNYNVLVLEYAKFSLQSYLEKSNESITWKIRLHIAHQIATAVHFVNQIIKI